MRLGFIALVDDEVAASEWEQELYRMGVPPEMQVHFADVNAAARQLSSWQSSELPGIVLTGDIATMVRLAELSSSVNSVNLGGIHHREGRIARLRYVYLSPEEAAALRDLAARGISVSAQDVPASRPIPLEDVLNGTGG